MNILIHPHKGNYRVLFFDESHVRGSGIVDLSSSIKGVRPDHYRLKWGGKSVYRNIPTKELILSLRQSTVRLTKPDPLFESFLNDFQVPFGYTDLCRICLLEDRITRIDGNTSVRYGSAGEQICFDCAKRELRREVAHMGRVGRGAAGHLESLLRKYRDIDRVLASIQPEQVKIGQTLFDRLDAHPVTHTQALHELALPRGFVDLAMVETLMPAQQIAVDAGLLHGKDLLVVAATASGKTFIGEMAGVKNYLEGKGQCLFLVPLVALAVQKYQRFDERYGKLSGSGLLIGKSRLNLPDNRQVGDRNVHAPLLVATYEGLDHLIRCGGSPGRKIGTVVIDEVQMLEDPERGHRLDGLIARLKFIAPKAQFLYLSATIGSPKTLAKKLGATLVQYDERPVALERYLMFTAKKEKVPAIKQLAEEEYTHVSSKGYHGQTIVFTNTRARCHVVADLLGPRYAPYHAGLTSQERRDVEGKFAAGKLVGVITTAALGAGVDFPASQVIFDALSMGISWLSVGEFNQMAGRAGRPDFHDLGKVVVLAEPGATYSRESKVTEEEVALLLLKGEMEEVAPVYGTEESSEELVANAIVCNGDLGDLREITESMVGSVEPVLDDLVAHKLVRQEGGKVILSDLARIMAEHFLGMEHLLEVHQLVRKISDPVEIVAELECGDMEDTRPRDGKTRGKQDGRRSREPRGRSEGRGKEKSREHPGNRKVPKGRRKKRS